MKKVEEHKRVCPQCRLKIEGRANKIFCDIYCRSEFHYNRRKKNPSFFTLIDNQLKLNRKLLSYFIKSGAVNVRKKRLAKKGFDPHHFTHYWKHPKGDVYLFCYENGFCEKIISGKVYYVIIRWMDDMTPLEGIS